MVLTASYNFGWVHIIKITSDKRQLNRFIVFNHHMFFWALLTGCQYQNDKAFRFNGCTTSVSNGRFQENEINVSSLQIHISRKVLTKRKIPYTGLQVREVRRFHVKVHSGMLFGVLTEGCYCCGT